MSITLLGNNELLRLRKTAFLASSTIPLEMVLSVYDWATAKHEGCVVSGFSSKLERDVLHFLIKAKCPIVLVLARRMYSTLPDELKEPVEQGRMLIISMTDATRQSRATAHSRNRYICELADELLLVGVTEESSLFPLKEKYQSKLTNMTIGSRQYLINDHDGNGGNKLGKRNVGSNLSSHRKG